MKISSSHNTITTIIITTITMVGVGMGPSSWCLDIVITTITTTTITATIAATIESALRTIGKQDPRGPVFVCGLLLAGLFLRRAMKMPVGAVKHDLRR